MSEASQTAMSEQKHPKGLYALFLTEMWERFSYYGMRALLVLYLVNALGKDRPQALGIYAVYTGLVYLTPLFGGRLADRYLGQRKAVFIGGILMALGQFAMTQPSLLNLGLGLLIVGNGFFKPNISTMVGTLYPEGDERKDAAYTIFYMGINLGAFLAPLICGPLGENYGWWPGFAAAGAGMSLGVMTFVFTQRLLLGAGLPPGREASPDAVLLAKDWMQIGLLTAVLALGVYGVLEAWPFIRPIWAPTFLDAYPWVMVGYKGALLIAVLAFFLEITEPRRKRPVSGESELADAMMDDPAAVKTAPAKDGPLTSEDWQRIAVIVIISLFSIVFWMGFEQSGGTLNLFADQQVDRHVSGWEMPASLLQSINPLFIILLAPVFARLWIWVSKREIPLPSFAKQGLGLILLGVGFCVMYLADRVEAPTPAFPDRLASAFKAVPPVKGETTEAEVQKDEKGKVIANPGALMGHAEEEYQKGRIPYRDLSDTLDSLKKQKAPTATIEPVQAAYDEAVKSRVSPWWLILTYFLFTVAELFLSPIGLSLVNRLAPWKLASLMMACWFLCTAAANYLAGIIDPILEHYPQINLWAFLGVMAAVPGVLMIAVTPLLVKMSHGRA